MEIFTMDEIHPNLWQGSKPPEGRHLSDMGFQVVVFCAWEIQPQASSYPDLDVIYAPNDDNFYKPLSEQELKVANQASKRVAKALQASKKVLVTCAMGWNRSGLVSALTLHRITGMSGKKCVAQVKEKRYNALNNHSFVSALLEIKPLQIDHSSR